jgi:hypothetical protein
MKRYTLDLAAGVPLTVNVGGEFFLLDSAPLGGVSVEFFGSGGLSRDVRIDSGVESVFARPKDGFASLRITSVALQSVAFYIARGEVGVNRFSGSVTVNGLVSLDPEDARYTLFGDDESRDGEAFIAGSLAGPTPGQVTVHQLFNPAASGKILYLDEVYSGANTAVSRHVVYRQAVAGGALVMNGQNKSLAGANGVGQYRVSNGALGGTALTQFNNALSLKFLPPMRLPEGTGITLEDTAVNQATIGSFSWREKPN